MIELLARDRPGHSAARRHRRIRKAWRHRVFGRRTHIYTTALAMIAIFVLAAAHLSSRWALFAGMVYGMTLVATWMFPEAVMPSHIFNWQLGAWGEQNTASELQKLKREGWTIRHDVRWGDNGANHDHVVAGKAVYVLNSKNVKDSRVTIEGKHLRVQRIDDPENSYLADRWIPSAGSEARSLKWELDHALTFRVTVYPVIVLWGGFDEEPRWIGNVFVMRGDKVADWIRNRPADLLDPAKREEVAKAVRSMHRA